MHETLFFAAMLRLPKHKTKAEKVGASSSVPPRLLACLLAFAPPPGSSAARLLPCVCLTPHPACVLPCSWSGWTA